MHEMQGQSPHYYYPYSVDVHLDHYQHLGNNVVIAIMNHAKNIYLSRVKNRGLQTVVDSSRSHDFDEKMEIRT